MRNISKDVQNINKDILNNTKDILNNTKDILNNSKDIQNTSYTCNNKNDANIRNSLTFQFKKNNQVITINDLNEKKQVNQRNNTLFNKNNKDKKENKDSIYSSKNRLLYEKIKKKIVNNNRANNNLYNNYINMKITKDNKNANNFNKTFTSSNINSILKNNLNMNNSAKKKKSEKKITQKGNTYYNKNSLNNNDIKGISNKFPKNLDILYKKRGSIPDNSKNFNFNKYLMAGNKYQPLYKSKKDGNKINIYKQLNNSISTNKNNNKNNISLSERMRTNSINVKTSFNRKINNTTEISGPTYSGIQEKKEKIIKIFKDNKNISAKEEAFYILSISPILRLSEQLIFSRASKNMRKVLPIDTVIKNHNIFLNMKVKELKNEINLCEKRIKTPFAASKIADITLNFITSLDEQEFKDFDILETSKEVINFYHSYIKLFHILFNFNYSNDLDRRKLKKNLYDKTREKGFKHLRDYLYYIYIAKKEKVDIVSKIDNINNDILKNCPGLLSIHENIKICRFTAFSNYLLKEIIAYANNIKDTIELKYRAQYFLDIVMGKIEKMKNKKSSSKFKPKKKHT